MESISAGSGTQSVFLKLNWSTIKSVTDTSVFRDTENTTGSTSSGKSGGSGSSLAVGTGNLKAPSSSSVQTDDKQDMMSVNNAQSTEADSSVNTAQTEDDGVPMAVPSIISIFVSMAGILYKAKSRGLF